jgi:hypothetical protein
MEALMKEVMNTKYDFKDATKQFTFTVTITNEEKTGTEYEYTLDLKIDDIIQKEFDKHNINMNFTQPRTLSLRSKLQKNGAVFSDITAAREIVHQQLLVLVMQPKINLILNEYYQILADMNTEKQSTITKQLDEMKQQTFLIFFTCPYSAKFPEKEFLKI